MSVRPDATLKCAAVAAPQGLRLVGAAAVRRVGCHKISPTIFLVGLSSRLYLGVRVHASAGMTLESVSNGDQVGSGFRLCQKLGEVRVPRGSLKKLPSWASAT